MSNADKYNEFVQEFDNIMKNKKYDNIVFLCIGTDRITGDCFGPIVGSILMNKLKNYNIPNMDVIGCLEDNISFEKIENRLSSQISTYKNPLIISIDAALSNKNNVGEIFVKNSGIELGKSLNKKQKIFGDISIKAVVGKNMKCNQENFRILQNIPLNKVMKLSNLVANGIIDVMYKKMQSGKNIYI